MNRSLLVLVAISTTAEAATVEMDSGRGQRVFESESCIQCHAIDGKGGHVAPDLGRSIDRSFTPAALASTMWNHAPTMWVTMAKENVKPGGLDEQAAADLFAYFYAAHFFDKPGDAGRGKRLFHERKCDHCHGLTNSPDPAAPPESKWQSLADPVELTQAMWNHSGAMYKEIEHKKMSWPQLTGQDFSDLLVYFRNLPETPVRQATFIITAGSQGEALFQSKGCQACHDVSKGMFRNPLGDRTLTDVAAALWGHAPKMKTPLAHFEVSEMRELLSYLWASQFFTVEGNAARGKKTFQTKHCAACHDDPSSGAPELSKRRQAATGSTMVSVLWRHGPQMLEQMQKKGIRWPRFESREMSDVIAYLNSRRNK
jgi:mono/diheme cytochrome c family protein